MTNLINESQILETWAPLLEDKVGVTDSYKKSWLSKYCHYHKMNEGFAYGTSVTLGNTPGMGPVRPAAAPGGPLQFHAGQTGSGDKFPSLLPMSIQVAARTVGFDVVNVIPMPGPTGVLTYLDYVYAGGKIGTDSKPLLIKINAPNLSGGKYVNGTHYWGVNSVATGETPAYALNAKAAELIFVGYSRVDGYPIFRVGDTYYASSTDNNWTKDSSITLAEVFDQTAVISVSTSGKPDQTAYVFGDPATAKVVSVTAKPQLVNALEDHIQGFAGSGTYDQDSWSGNNANGLTGANPMGRGTGESTYYRTMGLNTYTKFIEAETFQVAANVTTEQIQDLNKQYGIDVISMIENNLVNEISQNINKHILSRLFALGWSNNKQFLDADGVTLNFSLDKAQTTNGVSPAYLNKLGFTEQIAFNKFASYGDFENMHTIQRRIQSKLIAAGNIISQRGRRGQGNFVITNIQIATALQDSAQFTFAPMNNTINQNNGSLYPVGTISGMTLYVDPNMGYDDTRILVGRKGSDEEPGVKFMPYLMAESIQTIAEGTMAPKIAVKSRYALAEAGQYPETQYYTIYCHLGNVPII